MGARHKIVLGLGNPGSEYDGHRHNVGAGVVAELARDWGWREGGRTRLYWEVHGERDGVDVMLVRSRTYMNETGRAVTALLAATRVEPADLLVVLDDWQLPLGKVRFRARGSDGGHKGLRSVLGALGVEELPRCRIGIGVPVGESVDFVLSSFTREEREALIPARPRVKEAIDCWLRDGTEAAMNRYNHQEPVAGDGAALDRDRTKKITGARKEP